MYQIEVRALDGRTRCLQIPTPQIRVRDLKQTISNAIRIPVHLQRLVTGIKNLHDESLLFAENNKCEYPGVSLLLRLRGGKGGFGSLLRGAATKAGQKKTSNFDACRDMNGRRLRHVNAEKKLEDWRAEAEDRKLETIAQEFLKKKAKELSKTNSKGVDEGARDVAKYRAETSRAMEEVEEAVKDALKGNLKANSKRKGRDSVQSQSKKGRDSVQSQSKKAKLWMLDEEEDDDDEDEEMEEKVNDNDRKEQISDSRDFSINDSVKEESNAGSSGVDSNVLEIEALTVTEECKEVSSDSSNSDMAASAEVPLVSDKAASVSSAFCNETSIGSCKDGPIDFSTEGESGSSEPSEKECDKQDGAVGRYGEHKPADSQVSVRDMQVNSTEKVETSNSQLAGILEGTDSVCHSNGNDYSMEALNFDCFNTAKEMEALGLERLKIELQTRGLKCGGSLSERAARLFLLKTTPLNKLPNKLFAKSK